VKLEKKPRRPNGACSRIIELAPEISAGHREALDQAQDDQQHRRQQADLRVRRQQPDGDGREAHQEHAGQEHALAAVGVAEWPRTNAPMGRAMYPTPYVASEATMAAVGLPFREEDLREDQRRRGRVDEEVVVLERGAHPAARGGLAALLSPCVLPAVTLFMLLVSMWKSWRPSVAPPLLFAIESGIRRAFHARRYAPRAVSACWSALRRRPGSPGSRRPGQSAALPDSAPGAGDQWGAAWWKRAAG
jgi:hypothetical protein